MYKPELEFLGLICFFIVNVMYSASIGVDISNQLTKIYNGEGSASRWIVLVLIAIIIIALIFNFTSSVFTVMTLGNLYSEFEVKGLPIMLSPEYRSELNSVKGLFITSIVMITILTLRIFLTPDQMAFNFFEWMKYIPDSYSNVGHFILCLVVFGLAVTMFKLIYTGTLNYASENVVPDFTEGFKRHFLYLNIFLVFIVLWYLLPPAWLLFNALWNWNKKTTIYETALNDTTQNYVSLFTIVFMFASFLITIFSILGLTMNANSSPENTIFNSITLSGALFLMVVYFLMYIFVRDSMWLRLLLAFGTFYIGASALLYLAISKTTKNMFFMQSPEGNPEFIFINVALIVLCVLLSIVWVYSALITSISEVSSTNSSVINALFYIFGMIIIPVGLIIYKDNSTSGSISEIFDKVNTNLDLKQILVSMVEMFNIIKGSLIGISLIFAFFTIKEYTYLPYDTKFAMYNNKFKFDSLFGVFILFLLIVLVTSFLNSDNFPLLLTMSIEYLFPVALLIISLLLIYYTDHLAKLTKKHPISDLEKKKAIKEDTEVSK
jgi:hypothetical protein